jgi:hypothetical protein
LDEAIWNFCATPLDIQNDGPEFFQQNEGRHRILPKQDLDTSQARNNSAR